MSDVPYVVVFKSRTPLPSGNMLTLPWPPSPEFLGTLDVRKVEFFQRLEGRVEDYRDNPVN